MRSRGLAPLSLVGVVLVLMGFVWSAVFSLHGHHQALSKTVSEALLDQEWQVQHVRARLKSLLRLAVENALVECERRGYFDEHMVELIASARFWSWVCEWSALFENQIGIRISLPPAVGAVDLKPLPDGRVLATISETVRIETRTPDASVRLSLPARTLSVVVASRFFLLENLMGRFLDELSDGLNDWWKLEYARMWGEAWLGGRITLSPRVEKLLFESAWVLEEKQVFGAFDPYGAASVLTGVDQLVHTEGLSLASLDGLDQLGDLLSTCASELQKAEEGVGEAISALDSNDFSHAIGWIRDVKIWVGKARSAYRQALADLSMGNGGMEEALWEALASNQLLDRIESTFSLIEEALERAENVLCEVVENENSSWKVGTAENRLQELLELPDPVWRVAESYEGDPPQRVEKRVPFYLHAPVESIPALRLTLEGMVSDLDTLCRLEPQAEQREMLEIPSVPRLTLPFNRELYYRTAPPVVSDSGVAVYHELSIESVEYHREDPAGLFGAPTATPVGLPFFDLYVWWGQVRIVVRVGEGVEEVIDSQNPVLPQPTDAGWLHLPYARREGMGEREFDTRVVVLSLRPFSFVQE